MTSATAMIFGRNNGGSDMYPTVHIPGCASEWIPKNPSERIHANACDACAWHSYKQSVNATQKLKQGTHLHAWRSGRDPWTPAGQSPWPFEACCPPWPVVGSSSTPLDLREVRSTSLLLGPKWDFPTMSAPSFRRPISPTPDARYRCVCKHDKEFGWVVKLWLG